MWACLSSGVVSRGRFSGSHRAASSAFATPASSQTRGPGPNVTPQFRGGRRAKDCTRPVRAALAGAGGPWDTNSIIGLALERANGTGSGHHGYVDADQVTTLRALLARSGWLERA